MTRFLCLRLYGPMVAWGEIAIGERRPAVVHPSRSGVLGLVAGALGLLRTDSEALAALNQELGFASCVHTPGELLVDYHTAQTPSGTELRTAEKKGKRIETRKDELEALSDGNAIQSWRTYFLDAHASACLWTTVPSPRFTLEQIDAALRAPQFVPYLGRKSCPLGLPTDSTFAHAEHPVAALQQVKFKAIEGLASLQPKPDASATFRWEDPWDGLTPGQTSMRRDRSESRDRWQFSEREEHTLHVAGGAHVPESR